jgi:hypothetical protein
MALLKSQKTLFFSLILLFCFGLFGLFVPKINASPVSVSLNGFQTNQNVYVQCGNYSIYATDLEILFYNGNSSLAKTWNIPISGLGYGSVQEAMTNILPFNSSWIMVTSSILHDYYGVAGSYTEDSSQLAWLINVNTLYSDLIMNQGYNYYNINSVPQNGENFITINIGNTYYFLFSWSPITYSRLYEIYPSVSVVGTVTNNAYLANCTLWIPSESDSTCVYFVTSTGSGSGTRAYVYKMQVTTFTITQIGETGFSDTYSTKYAYLVDWFYQGNINCYNFFVVYPDAEYAKYMEAQIITFNDTFIGTAQTPIDLSTDAQSMGNSQPELIPPMNLIRPLSVQLPANTYGNGTLENNSNYNIIYIAKNYVFMYIIVKTVDMSILSSLTQPHVIIPAGTFYGFYPSQANPQTFYFSTSYNIGGYLNPFSNIIFELDYQNSLAVACTTNPPNGVFSYAETISPTFIANPSSGKYQLYQNTQYALTGFLTFNGINVGNGVFYVASTGLFTSSYTTVNNVGVPSGATYSNVTSGAITNGQFTLYFSPRNNPNANIFEGIRIIMIFNNGSYEFIRYDLFEWSTQASVSPSGGSSGGFGNINLMWFMVVFLCIGTPAMVLGFKFGTMGFVGGLILGMGVMIATGLLPIWFLVFLGLLVLAILFIEIRRGTG